MNRKRQAKEEMGKQNGKQNGTCFVFQGPSHRQGRTSRNPSLLIELDIDCNCPIKIASAASLYWFTYLFIYLLYFWLQKAGLV